MQLAERIRLEARVAEELSKLSAKARQKILAQLGDPPDVANLDPSFWSDLDAERHDAMTAAFLVLWLAMWDVIVPGHDRRRAALLGERYATTRARESQAIMSRSVRRAIAAADAGPAPMSEHDRRISAAVHRFLNPGHMTAVSRTEMTAAASDAIITAADSGFELLASDGKKYENPKLIWRLEMIRSVESHCGFCPLMDGTGRDTWARWLSAGPPAHFQCACGISIEPPDYPERPLPVSPAQVLIAAQQSNVFGY